MAKKKKNHGFSSDGTELTDELIEKLAKEAEEGYDLSRLTPRRGRPPIGSEAAEVFQVRLDPELRRALDKRAEDEGSTPSELARTILRRALISPKRTQRSPAP
jgi:CRISPR-associated endonuclease/helicase Cas3